MMAHVHEKSEFLSPSPSVLNFYNFLFKIDEFSPLLKAKIFHEGISRNSERVIHNFTRFPQEKRPKPLPKKHQLPVKPPTHQHIDHKNWVF